MKKYTFEDITELREGLNSIITFEGDYIQKEGTLNDYEIYYIDHEGKRSKPNEYIMIIPEYMNCWQDKFNVWLFDDTNEEIQEASEAQKVFSFDEIKYMYTEEEAY